MNVSQIQPLLNQYFLSPYGLLALSALLPLLIFYLIKKRPEEELMPSMMFFMENKKSGKVRQAFRRLLKNWLLIFHIFLIIGISAALAEPFVNAESSPDSSVLVLDRSASMSNNLGEAKNFLTDNLGDENTLIVVDQEVSVPVEQRSSTLTRTEIRSVDPIHTESDIVSALETARTFEGDIFVASDLSQSVTEEDPEPLIEDIRDGQQNVEIMEPSEQNSWGIIDIEPGFEESEIDIRNFMGQDVEIEMDVNGEVEQLDIEANSVRTETVDMETGENTVKLENDRMEVDDTAYISVPETGSYDVKYIADQENPYLREAFELINITEFEYAEPPLESEPEADIFIIGETDSVLSETIEGIENQVESGAGLVVLSHEGVFDQGFNSLPAESGHNASEQTVSIQEPVRTTFETQVMALDDVEGEEYSSGSQSLIKTDYGDGEVLFYNLNDEDFRYDFMYPIFWQRTAQQMVDQPSLEQLNRETGDSIQEDNIVTPEAEQTETAEMEKVGFYQGSDHTYSSNLLSEEESSPTEIDIELTASTEEDEEGTVELQNLILLLIVGLLLAELLYLRRIGDLR